MSASIKVTILSLCIVGVSCSQAPQPSTGQASAGIDSLNARLVRAYQTSDPQAYAALYTDTAVFEWPAFNTVRGHAELEAMARSNWATLRDMDLKGAPYGYTPFCDSNKDMEGFRFWKSGYWKNHLSGRPYHIR